MEISNFNKGKTITIKRLAEIMLELQKQRVHNINLVTPTIFIPSIIKAIKLAKKWGLTIPIVYNSSGYENVEIIKLLDGLIDIYLPDFKYFNNDLAIKYSKANNYVENTKLVINEMVKQTGKCIFDKNGIIKKGTIVRHLLLPGMTSDTKKIINYLYTTYQDNIYLSIMNQYTPNKYVTFNELKRKIYDQEYNDVIDYAVNLGVNNAYCQIGDTAKNSFIPEFNYQGIKKS
jgi:putative pyruvate formate lyase activating enzyme